MPLIRSRLMPGRGGLARQGEDNSEAYWLENFVIDRDGQYRPRYGTKWISQAPASADIVHLARPGGYNHNLMVVANGSLYQVDVEAPAWAAIDSGWPTVPLASAVAVLPSGSNVWCACKSPIGGSTGNLYKWDGAALTEIKGSDSVSIPGNYVGMHGYVLMRVSSGDGSKQAMRWSNRGDANTFDVLNASPPLPELGTVDAVVPMSARETLLLGPNGLGHIAGLDAARSLSFEPLLNVPIATPMRHVAKCRDRVMFLAGGPRVMAYQSPGVPKTLSEPLFRDLFLAAGTNNLRAWYDSITDHYVLWDRTQKIGYCYNLTTERWDMILSHGQNQQFQGQAVIDQGASTVDQATQPWSKGFMGAGSYLVQWDPNVYTDATGAATTQVFTCAVETQISGSPDIATDKRLVSLQVDGNGTFQVSYRWRASPSDAWTTVVSGNVQAPGVYYFPLSSVVYRERVVRLAANGSSTLRFRSAEIVERVVRRQR